MAIRVLNCGTIRPYLPRVEGGVTSLLVETNQGLILVDTGFGTRDYLAPTGSMKFFLSMMRSVRDGNETAIQQIQRLGYKSEEVNHIIQTHLHLDHAGGLLDFPHAYVHVLKAEYDHVMSHHGWEYRSEHWAHHPKWVLHEEIDGKWFDFDGIRLEGLGSEIWLIPLTGHTPGHCGVAVKQKQDWVFLGGDAVPFDMRLDKVPDWISKLAIGPHVPRIRAFMKSHPEVQVIGSHMSWDFYRKSG